MQASNASIDIVETRNPVELLKTDGYDAIMMLNVANGKVAVDVYVRGKLSQLAQISVTGFYKQPYSTRAIAKRKT
ncbi:MAG TPA: hypothetical protein EYP33_08140 [Pyrodictium sp.]|nr:hypothetical protein [Pyrodictium sp.]